MPRKKKPLLQVEQLVLVVDEKPMPSGGGVVTILCDSAKLAQLIEFAQQKLGDRLASHAVLVDLTISGATEADVELFRTMAAPVEMIVDWELEATDA